ncbi:Fic family protein [Campylobacter helveticus]|uniref:protein adenylyltransferase n=1 Tax=Campylobacter helveticus TaxID=28898 RepID=A0ABY3KZ62_9BACT|nr:Fic family protein [Campylobacter helveticus]MCR2039727.1 Fic family protein [Campylobacter helveticus]MCR2060343.1 Fic family protein [Campylobacter helveticus]TXK53778.1 cell filamentation protein Fic [Campylobacter helveticus]
MWDTQDTYTDIDTFLLSTNKVNATSLSDLEHKERILAQLAMQELSKNEIKGNFNYEHLKAIHQFIFKDIYTWAGKDRYEEKFFKALHKGDSQFCVGVLIPQESKRIFDGLMEKELLKTCKNDEQFIKELANFMADLNAMHPFCEGNGRTQRIFINQLAKNAGYELDLNLTPKEIMLRASIEAMNHQNSSLEKIIKNNLKKIDMSKQREIEAMQEAVKKASQNLKPKDKSKDLNR